MLRFNLTHIFKAKAITKPSSEIVKAGFSPSIATKIRQGKINSFNLKYVEKLCNHFQCTPNDLLEWQPSAQQQPAENHALYPLLRNQKQSELIDLLNNLPYNKLQQAQDLLKNL